MCSGWRRRWLGSHRHGFLYAQKSSDDRYINAHKELYQLAENNREIETRQINIKIEVIRFFCLHLRHVQSSTQHETLCIHTAWISDILRKTSLSSHSDLGMSPRSCFFTSLNVHQTLAVRPSAGSEYLTFSNLPISSRSPDLLGVVVSTLPSASLPGHNNNRCFPLRSVLSPPSTSH